MVTEELIKEAEETMWDITDELRREEWQTFPNWRKVQRLAQLQTRARNRVSRRHDKYIEQIRQRRDPAGDRIGHAVPSHFGPDTSKEWA